MKQMVNRALVTLSIAVVGFSFIPVSHPTQYDLKAQKEQIKDLEYKLKMAKQRKRVRDCGGQEKVDFTTNYAYSIYKEARDDSPEMGHIKAEVWTEYVLKSRQNTGICREYIDHIDWVKIQRRYALQMSS